MLIAFDTFYGEQARTAAICFEEWDDESSKSQYIVSQPSTEPYIPGQFYKKELPCIHGMLRHIFGSLQVPSYVRALIVDSFVYIDDEKSPGMGAHLYNSLETKVPVIGVAKSAYATVSQVQRLVYRGDSKRPLFITSIGIDVDEAAALIASMHGKHRLPTLLKLADQTCRETA